MWCLKCDNIDEHCACDLTTQRLEEYYQENLGLLAKRNIQSRSVVPNPEKPSNSPG